MVLSPCLCPTATVCPHFKTSPSGCCNECFWLQKNLLQVAHEEMKASSFSDYSRLCYVKPNQKSKAMAMVKEKETVFRNSKTGVVTNTLWKKKGEDEKAFFLRMKNAGYDNTDNVEKHWSADSMVLHSGPQQNCLYCKRSNRKDLKSKPTSKGVVTATPKDGAGDKGNASPPVSTETPKVEVEVESVEKENLKSKLLGKTKKQKKEKKAK